MQDMHADGRQQALQLPVAACRKQGPIEHPAGAGECLGLLRENCLFEAGDRGVQPFRMQGRIETQGYAACGEARLIVPQSCSVNLRNERVMRTNLGSMFLATQATAAP